MKTSHTLLIVEDDTDLQHFLREFFSKKGFEVHVTGLGKEAIKIAQQTPPSLIILDLGLPDMDGETVCLQLKNVDPSIPVIILSANDDTQSVVGTFGKGADDYINKPFNNDELWARVRAKLKVS